MSLAEATPQQTPDYSAPVLDSILLATEFTEGSLAAFHHALKAALISKCVLTAPEGSLAEEL